jgi:hypothetical protein
MPLERFPLIVVRRCPHDQLLPCLAFSPSSCLAQIQGAFPALALGERNENSDPAVIPLSQDYLFAAILI